MHRVLLIWSLLLITFSVVAQTKPDTTSADNTGTLPTYTLDVIESESDEMSQDVSGLLQSSRDIFVSTAGYTFGAARYRIRGYDNNNLTVFINGVKMNDMESGRAYWSSWGGLNDATWNKDIRTGIVSSELSFGGVAGVTEINTRPSLFRKQFRFTYSSANRSYTNRLMATYSTGEMANGWSFVVSGSRRWAQEGYVEGSFYDAWAYFLGVEKKINERQSLSLVIFGSPNRRGKTGVSVQEAYDLSGNNFYNPYWGYQNGEKRNARVGNYHQPMTMLTHYWKISENTKSQATLSYWFGRGGSTALNWTETDDPRPDYYRYLPSYWNLIDQPDVADALTQKWQTDEKFRQLDFDYMYFANSKFLFTVNDANGIQGNDITGLRSKIILEDRRNDKKEGQFDWRIFSTLNDYITVSGGINLNIYKGHRYKTIDDLLGGEYWLDIDRYADQDPFIITDASQNDLNNPNRLVTEGDIFGYDYLANINTQNGFGEADFHYSKVDFYVGLSLSNTTFWRTGNMKNGRFPDNSYGDSEKNNFFNYGVKGGVTYKINGKHYITANAMYKTRAPLFWNSYVSARTRDFTVPNLKSETIYSGDLSYIIRTPVIKFRATAYYTQFKDQTWTRSFYHDALHTFVNYSMTGLDELHTGVELGLEATLSPTWTLTAVAAKGQNYYTSRPTATITRDNDAIDLVAGRTVYLENYYVGGSPQTVASLGLKYSSPKYWFAQVKANYFGDTYISINPDRRTAEALNGLYSDDYRVAGILDQEKLADGFTLDLFGGKSWKINHTYTIGFLLSINNLLGTTDYRMSGFEQLRYDNVNINKFPPKYYYMYGRTYFLNLYFRM